MFILLKLLVIIKTMKHEYLQRVYYADTDSYGVVWHGSYLRWMEAARCEFCRVINIDLIELAKNDITIPVTNINIKYKSPAKIDDEIVVETELIKLNALYATFKQVIKNANSEKVCTVAEVDVVTVHNDGVLYRRMPEVLYNKLKETLVCSD